MPKYNFEAMDAVGKEIVSSIEADNEQEAQDQIRKLGYFVTRIRVDKPESRSRIEYPLAKFSILDMIRELLYRFIMFFYLLLPTRKCSCCTGKCND